MIVKNTLNFPPKLNTSISTVSTKFKNRIDHFRIQKELTINILNYAQIWFKFMIYFSKLNMMILISVTGGDKEQR